MYVLVRLDVERKDGDATYDFTDVVNHVREVLLDETKHDERIGWKIRDVQLVHMNMGGS